MRYQIRLAYEQQQLSGLTCAHPAAVGTAPTLLRLSPSDLSARQKHGLLEQICTQRHLHVASKKFGLAKSMALRERGV
jgi:hypothetical protein